MAAMTADATRAGGLQKAQSGRRATRGAYGAPEAAHLLVVLRLRQPRLDDVRHRGRREDVVVRGAGQDRDLRRRATARAIPPGIVQATAELGVDADEVRRRVVVRVGADE